MLAAANGNSILTALSGYLNTAAVVFGLLAVVVVWWGRQKRRGDLGEEFFAAVQALFGGAMIPPALVLLLVFPFDAVPEHDSMKLYVVVGGLGTAFAAYLALASAWKPGTRLAVLQK